LRYFLYISSKRSPSFSPQSEESQLRSPGKEEGGGREREPSHVVYREPVAAPMSPIYPISLESPMSMSPIVSRPAATLYPTSPTRITGSAELLDAARGCDLDRVQGLLGSVEADSVKTRNGETALMLAAGAGSLPIVCVLLRKNADAHAKDRYGKTPMMHAAQAGQLQVVVELAGPCREVLQQPCQWGFTARDWAKHHGHSRVAAALRACEKGTFQKDDYPDCPPPQPLQPVCGLSIATDLVADTRRWRDSFAPRGQEQGENRNRVMMGADAKAEKQQKSVAETGVNKYRLPPPPAVGQ